MKRYLLVFLALLFYGGLFAQTTYTIQYWFDGKYEAQNTISNIAGSWNDSIDISSLDFGFHTLYLQTKDTSNRWFPTQVFSFFALTGIEESFSMVYTYWFDQDYSNRQSGNISGENLLIDVAGLDEGFHQINIQTGEDNKAKLETYYFYKLPLQNGEEFSMVYTYWFDQDYSNGQSGSVGNGNLLIDVANLDEGFHQINIQTGEDNKAKLETYYFYKLPLQNGEEFSMVYTYWFDQDYSNGQSGSVGNGNLLIDVANLDEGFHQINIQIGENNKAKLETYCFYKDSYNTTLLTKYEYWLNGDYSTTQITELSPHSDTLTLVTLLPVASQPIRSSCFQFDYNGGSPIVYAKNDISFRFWDTERKYTERSFKYIDENVADTIVADTLERDTTKNISAPNNNSIHWFKLYAETGDSLSFHTDKSCHLQLFAPSGEEVFASQDEKSLSWNGCHAWEDGVYYLAVHDASSAETQVSVSYQWIYRYAVLSWDVHRVGNGGISTITFEGNGFDSLDTVYLVNDIDTIPSLYIDRKSNTTVSVAFDFQDRDTLIYNAIFNYIDETIYQSEIVKVEEAKPILLVSNVSFPITFLRGSKIVDELKVTNTGNGTAYKVPLHIYIKTKNKGAINHIKLDGLNLMPITDKIDMSSLPANEIRELENWAEKMGDDHCFLKTKALDEDSGDSAFVRSNYFFFTLAPYETKTISLSLTATEAVDVWFTLLDTIETLKTPNSNPSHQPHETSNWGERARQSYCCIKDKISCALNLAGGGLDLVESIADATPGSPLDVITSASSCIVGLLNDFNTGMGEWLCQKDGQQPSWMDKFMNWNSVTSSSIACIKHFMPNISGKNFINLAERVTDLIGDMFGDGIEDISADCVSAFSTKQSDCMSSTPQGGKSSPVVPVDPNDITGYIAESGSLFVGASQEQMNYTIEFENDTNFATANANKVTVTDTLDGSIFDLNSFSATAFTIGESIFTVDGGQSFVSTIDMRPDIDALCQVELDYRIDSAFAIAKWTFSSLDPMTLEPITDPARGFLPANYNGDGIGEVDFLIKRKKNLSDSTIISNQAYIVFDNEDAIPTSVWTNIVDITPPASSIDTIIYSEELTTLSINAHDNLSGIWKYNIYAQVDSIFVPLALDVPFDSVASIEAQEGQYSSLVSQAIDSAGNIEPLIIIPPYIPVFSLQAMADTNQGFVTGSGIYDSLTSVTIEAMPNYGYRFVKWDDDNTDNPRTIVLTQDTILSAVFTTFDTTYTSVSICEGETYSFFNRDLTQAGVYLDSIPNTEGYYDFYQLSLQVNYPTTTTIDTIVCGEFVYGNETYTTSQTITDNLQTYQGCDSVVTINLTVNYPTTTIIDTTVCGEFVYGNETYTTSQTITDNLQTYQGCDSVVTINLTVNYPATTTIDTTVCGEFVYNYVTFTGSQTIVDNLQTYQGCDSVVTINLTVNYPTTTIIDTTVCGEFVYGNETYTSSQTITDNLQTYQGCDSIVTINLTVNYPASTIIDTTVCGEFVYNYVTFTGSQTIVDNLQTYQGCDSVVTINLTVNYPTTTIIDTTVCGEFVYGNETYTSSQTITDNLQTYQGCDSIVTINLTVNYPASTIIDTTVCGEFVYNYVTFTGSQTIVDNLQTINGCDSIVTINLTVNPIYEITVYDTVMIEGEVGEHYSETTVNNLQSEYGCDSTVTTVTYYVYPSGLNTIQGDISISLYPNPASGNSLLSIKGLNEDATVVVTDAQGRVISTSKLAMGQETLEIESKKLASGVYYIRIQTTNSVRTEKLIKK